MFLAPMPKMMPVAQADTAWVIKSRFSNWCLDHNPGDGVHTLVGHDVFGDLSGHRLDQVARRPGDDVGCAPRELRLARQAFPLLT